MSKFKVGDRVRRLPEYRNQGGWDRGDAVMIVEGFSPTGWPNGWLLLRDYPHGGSAAVCPRHFELVSSQMLARDELYMRLRNDAKLTHQQALDFIKECGSYAAIRYALDNQPNTGNVMAALVVWVGDNEEAYREGARRCGWEY